MKSHRKISNYLINERLQIEFALRHLGIAAVSAVLTAIFLHLTLWPVIASYIPLDTIGRLRMEVLIRLFNLGVPLVVVVTALCIVISHRVAGPLYSIEKTIDKALRGEDVNEIRLRKGDMLVSLAAKLNTILADRKQAEMIESAETEEEKTETDQSGEAASDI